MDVKAVARYTALGALFLIPLTPLVVWGSFFFPFITGKAFYFRFLVEVAVCAWAVLACLDKAYRPRFSWVGAAVFAFVVWMFVANLFALNVEKAFWSNFERMEGWMLLLHLLAFFTVASATFRAENKWRAWFLTSLCVSVVLILYAFMQWVGVFQIHQGSTRVDATLGNSTYFAIYLLFHTFIAAWLAFAENKPWLRYGLFGLAAVEIFFIFLTQTRGTILGLIGALALASVLIAISMGGRARQMAVGTLVGLLVVVSGFMLIRDTDMVRNSDLWNRIAHISLHDGQTRFTLWGIAFEGFKERPVVGWGQEGFNYVFNKYYDPALFAQEQWFDRAHNAFIDWLMAGGLPAFLLYLSLFGTAIFSLWRSPLPRTERIALTGLLAAYAFHNLFVFDHLVSYIYFFAILALIDSQVGKPVAILERSPVMPPAIAASTALPISAAAFIALLFLIIVPGTSAASTIIQAISPKANLADNLAVFKDVLDGPVLGRQEVREQLVSFALSASGSQNVSSELKGQFSQFAVSEMQKEVEAHPLDARLHLQLALAYRALGDVPHALKSMEDALALSPKKIQIFIQIGATKLEMGDVAGARESFTAAYALGPQFPDLAVYAAAGEFLSGNAAKGRELLQESYGTTTVDSDVLTVAYLQSKNYDSLISLWQLRVQKPNATVETYFGLAGAYYVAGNIAMVRQTLNDLVKIHPEVKADVEAALKQL